jgi:hypothetical protein
VTVRDRIAYRNGLVTRKVRPRPTMVTLPVTERAFLEHVMTLAALHGWHGIHIIRSRDVMEGVHSLARRFPRGAEHDDAHGFPDLLLVHPARRQLLLVELKRSSGRLTVDQQRWLRWAADLGSCRAYCWRPEDEREIQHVLTEAWIND